MLEAFNKLGAKMASFWGEPEHGYSKVSMQDMQNKDALFSGSPFSEILPYEAFDEETGIFVSVNSLGFTIEAVPLVGGDSTSQKIISSLFTELMEEDSSIQCLLFADHRIEPFLSAWEAARHNSGEMLRDLTQKRAQFFRSLNGTKIRMFKFVISYSIPCKEYDQQILQRLKEKKEKFLEALKPITYAFAWKPENLLGFVGGIANFSFSPEFRKRQWNPLQSLSSQLTTGGKISVEEEKLSWFTEEESIFKSYRAVDFPSSWGFLDMQRLIGDVFRDPLRVHTPFYLHFGIHCPKQDSVESGFWKKAYLVENQGRSYTLLRWIPELEKELKEYDYVRRSLSQGARLVWTQFSTGIWSEKETFAQHEEVLKSLFRINQFTLAENRCLHLPHLLAALPMTWAEHAQDLKNLHLLRTTITDECVNFVPFQGEWMGTSSPCMLLSGRRGQVMTWNPFDNKTGNYNVVVSGRSGSGKSVFMQDLLLNALSIGAKVFILEVGRSFEKMGEILDGQQVEFSHESRLCLNPFSNISQKDKEAMDTAMSFLKSIISCMAAPTAGTSDLENALIEQAIRFAWESKGPNATITNVAEWLCKHKDVRAQTLGTMLTPYTKSGAYAKHFEGKNNVNFQNNMVLIELEELKDKKDLQAVVLQLFIMAITNQAFLGDRKTPFMICIDEAWDLLRGSQSGPFIETLARRLRKYNGSLVIGTQGIEDFFATPGSKAAFENSDWMCLFSQKKSSLTALHASGKLDLSGSRLTALESVTTRHGQYSEFMLCDAEGNYSISRLILDKFSELLYTTKAAEFAALQELKRKGHSMTEAIEIVLSRKNHV